MTCPGLIENNGICGECYTAVSGILLAEDGREIMVRICMNEKSEHFEHVITPDHPACKEKKE